MNGKDGLIRRAVLHGLARDRTPGWSFTGHFQNLQWPVIGADTMTVTLPVAPHCEASNGTVDLTALLVLFDAALASPTRLSVVPGSRLATSHINVQFTGSAATHDARVQAQSVSATQGGTMRQLLAHGSLFSGDQLVLTGNAAFVQIAPPAEVREMAPLPWQREGTIDPPPLTSDQLDQREAAVLAACDAALAACADLTAGAGAGAVSGAHNASFLQHFWGILPARTIAGAECRVTTGPQLANRVGHVQGGILMGLAAHTAQCAVPDHPLLSNLSAWFTGPGRGAALLAKSWPVHRGRNFAVVRTEITGENGARVLEATSAHAA